MSPYYHVKEYRKRKPWARPREWARRRCTDKNHREYPGYGGRGIRFSLTMIQAEFLFIRDEAWQFSKPSLDRIDPDGHYCLENCRFLELSVNVSLARKKGSIKK